MRVVVLFLILLGTYVKVDAQAPLTKVNGSVKDSHDAVVGYATIWFETKVDRKRFKQKVESDRAGVFEVELPAGTYRVTVKFSGFHNFKREGLIIESARPLTFDIILKENPRKIPAITEWSKLPVVMMWSPRRNKLLDRSHRRQASH